MSDTAFIDELESIIQSRLSNGSDESYTARLGAAGKKRIAQKLGEEAVELALASACGDIDEVRNEAADLLYHYLVLLNVQEITLADIATTLKRRHTSPDE